jgi:hypothetical protein
MLGVDVETDWGTSRIDGVAQVLARLVELLQRHGASATFFVVGDLARQVARFIPRNGPQEVASHGLTHSVLTRLSPERVCFEITESKRALEAEGYEVGGFRAPFLKCPRGMLSAVAAAGYRYDASLGSVYPSFRNRRRPHVRDSLARVGQSTLTDGLTPFNLTWLRLLHPISARLLPARASFFSCHLHEFLAGDGGWLTLPGWLRRLHARRCGPEAWRLLEHLLGRYRFVSCRSQLEAQGG